MAITLISLFMPLAGLVRRIMISSCGSNTELEDELVYHSATAVKWLVKDEENSGPVTKAASQETKYVYKVDETVLGNGKQEDIIILTAVAEW